MVGTRHHALQDMVAMLASAATVGITVEWIVLFIYLFDDGRDCRYSSYQYMVAFICGQIASCC